MKVIERINRNKAPSTGLGTKVTGKWFLWQHSGLVNIKLLNHN